MCTTCGCGAGETRIEGDALHDHEHGHEHWHVHEDGTAHSHGHEHGHGHSHAHDEHQHEHVHADGTRHSHPHHHDGEHHHGHQGVTPQPAAPAHGHVHTHADGTSHSHPHTHEGEHHHAHAEGDQGDHGHGHHHHHGDGSIDYGSGPAGAHAPGMSQKRMVQIERDILSKNDAYAAKNRQALAEKGVFALNLVSSPGSGKTTLLCRSIGELKAKYPVAVIEGDQQTSFDAERIRATGAPALQINTGKGCHLDAHMVGHALEKLEVQDDSLLLIENVGNLVCPAAFDLGEAGKVVILSVTEGEDKPLKYPDMFRAARLMLLSKVDLLPHLTFDADKAVEYARRVNPALEVIRVSTTSGEGFAEWLAWVEKGLAAAKAARQENVAALKARIAELEGLLARR
ncbi:hydrogenase nickel incorporation protein HypB [Azospira oryzae]|uniref:Hydrogenase maturation factor HypB n=1 Tax=Azospira oryzae TaxID=146939 RepID=A0ABY0ILS2_9RHOO|nr:hydrogenase nickel incorporation protein HypB [Azospira oryzae]RZT76136.1 hydrogenase nickel incorporation protein HypB [Azospira oryzae]